jgi:hypothetical protein
MGTSSESKPKLRCKSCGHVQEKGDWEAAMDRQAKAMGSAGFHNISARPQCISCGGTSLARLQSKQFEGKTVEEARAAAATLGIADSNIYTSEVRRTVKEVVEESVGIDDNAAIEAVKVKASIPVPDAFDIHSAEIVQHAEKGVAEVEAQTDFKARLNWLAKAPPDATLEMLECQVAPKDGFLGIGRKKGLWKVHWSRLAKARISYKLPAQVTVTYTE